MNKKFSRPFLRGANLPVIAAIIFFSITPGLLFAGPTNNLGVFAARIDPEDPGTTFRVRFADDNPDNIVLPSGSTNTNTNDKMAKRLLRPNPSTGNLFDTVLDYNTNVVIEQSFPANGTASENFSGCYPQVILAFFQSTNADIPLNDRIVTGE